MNTDDLMLFALDSSRDFGQRVASELHVPLSPHEERDFADGEHKVRPLANVRNRDVFVIQSLYADVGRTVNDKLCRLLFFLGALRDASAARITAVVPYLCYARKDRKTKSRDPVTTRYVARMFESVGAGRVLTMDVHNLAAYQNAFHSAIAEHLEAAPLFLKYIVSKMEQRELEDLVVASPDVGGVKRVDAFCTALEQATGRRAGRAFLEKYRSAGVVSGEAVVGDVEGKAVVLLDDMISSGTTLARAAAACRERGATRVCAAATHGLFIGPAESVLSAAGLEPVIVTNTVPPIRLSDSFQRTLVVLDTAPMFAEAVRRIHEGGSIVELLESMGDDPTPVDPPADGFDDPPSAHPRLPYADRREAGRELAKHLTRYADLEHVLVLALPRGGVPVAFEVSQALGAPLDVFVVRKLGFPTQPELAMGAIASGGVVIRNPRLEWIPDELIEEVAARELRELQRRESAYRGDRPPPKIAGSSVLLVDDGLATGSTMRAAIEGVRRQGATRVVVAVPLGAQDRVEALQSEADAVVCPATPAAFLAIGEFYEDFTQVSDDEVRRLLSEARCARDVPV